MSSILATKPPRDGRSLPRVRAVSRAVAILRTFSVDRPYLGLGEIADETGLDAGTIRRILITLKDEGLIQQDQQNGKYSLSLGILELSGAVPDTASLRDLLESRLITLSGKTGATVYLSVESQGQALCLARYHGKLGIEVRWWSVGETMPLNCGAGPRILLAHMDEHARNTFLASELPRLTAKTDIDREHLRDELKKIEATGYAITRDDVAVGLSALAMPLKNRQGKLIAAVSIGGLTPQIMGDEQPVLLKALSDAIGDMEPLVNSLPV